MKQQYNFRLDQELVKRARKKAAKENRNLTNYIETLIKNDLKKQ